MTEVLDFRAFCRGEIIAINKQEVVRRRKLFRTALRVGALSLVIISANPIPHDMVAMAAEQAKVTAEAGQSWDHLITGLLHLLDPIAKIFGLIAGIAIMTGNGKIGMERLFWLSLGYITARKVEVWINFLNTL